MKYRDDLTKHYSEILDGDYDCIDRIVLNAYCPTLLVPGGVRNWYRIIKGSDNDLDTNALMRFAGRFSKRVQAYAKSKAIPFIHFTTGTRKHTEAEKVITGRQIVHRNIRNILFTSAEFIMGCKKVYKRFDRYKTQKENINYFHIIDKQWGHITIRMCAHPPFSCNVILKRR